MPLRFPITYPRLAKASEPFPPFADLGKMVAYCAESIRPPENLTVTEAAERWRVVVNPGSYTGPWRASITPYIRDFQDTLTSPRHSACIFVGPAQCGKTDVSLNWLVHSVLAVPMDMMIIEKTQELARDFAVRRLRKLHEHSEALGGAYLPSASNVQMHRYRTGMILNLAWPTKNMLSGRPIPHLWLSDYDRMPENVDGEGDPFSLAIKRTTTFGRQAMTVAESSPSFPVEDFDWSPATPHEAPPARGILGLYNMGDRRRWYWMCVRCHKPFEPDHTLLKWPDRASIREAAEGAYLECPHCRAQYRQEAQDGMPSRNEMNRDHARWVPAGQTWDREKGLVGDAHQSEIASFWLKGVAAAFSTLPKIAEEILRAEREYARTGNEEVLKAVYNTTLGVPYVPKIQSAMRTVEALRRRAESYPLREVPPRVRFLIATIDVQGNRFEVQVHGITDAQFGASDWYVIDRFKVAVSRRKDESGRPETVEPHVFLEDWKLLVEEVLLRSYPLSDKSGRHMAIRIVGCDSAGLPGVSPNAYQFWRWLLHGPSEDEEDDTWVPGLHERFYLVKGLTSGRSITVASMVNKPRVKISYPDSGGKSRRMSMAMGDVPVVMMNPLLLKDEINAMLMRDKGEGRIILTDQLPRRFYKELVAEVRNEREGWVQLGSRANEAWDLLYYARGLSLLPDINLDGIDWSDPPEWARPWDENSLVFDGPEGIREEALEGSTSGPDLAALGDLLA